MSEPWNPSPPPPPPMNPPGGYMPPPPMNSVNALQAVTGPAVGLMVTGGLSILYGLYSIFNQMMGSGQAALNELMQSSDAQGMGPVLRAIQAGGVAYAVVILLSGAFLIWAGLMMKQGRKWPVSLAGSIVAMIPCVSCCFFVGIPVGIWALVVLMKPEVKAAFTA